MSRSMLVATLLVVLGASEEAEAQRFFSFQNERCTAGKAPLVEVAIRQPTHVVDHSRSYQEIRSLAQLGNISFGIDQYAPGLTSAEIASEANYQMESWQIGDGSWCSSLERIIVTLSLRQPAIVYIERDIPRSSCAYRAVLEHEMKHVATYDRTIYEGRARIAAVISAYMNREIPVGLSPDLELSRSSLIASAQGSVDLAVRSVLEFAEAMNRQIDTPQEYARVQASCNDWVR